MPADDHRLAADRVAQPPEQRRERESAHVVGGRHHADEPHRGMGLLLQEHGQVRQDGAETRPDDEAGRADDAQLEPLGALRAYTAPGLAPLSAAEPSSDSLVWEALMWELCRGDMIGRADGRAARRLARLPLRGRGNRGSERKMQEHPGTDVPARDVLQQGLDGGARARLAEQAAALQVLQLRPGASASPPRLRRTTKHPGPDLCSLHRWAGAASAPSARPR